MAAAAMKRIRGVNLGTIIAAPAVAAVVIAAALAAAISLVPGVDRPAAAERGAHSRSPS